MLRLTQLMALTNTKVIQRLNTMLACGPMVPVPFTGSAFAECSRQLSMEGERRMRSWRRWSGQHGEQMAVQFLQRQGYRILHQNYRCRGGEVDIVAWDGPTLVFIEVKTKGQVLFGAPQAMVDARKQKKIVHVAMIYVQQHQLQDANIRFDVVAITLLPGLPPEVTHVPGAFTPSSHFLY